MHYTKFMDKCRQKLIEAAELESDLTIDALVSIYSTCNEVNETFTLYDVESSDVKGDIAIRSLVQSYLERLRSVQDQTLTSVRHLTYAKLFVHEVAVHKQYWPSKTSAIRIQTGCDGIECGKVLLQQYVDMLAEETIRMSAAEWMQLLYTLIILNKLAMTIDCNSYPSVNGVMSNPEIQHLGEQFMEKMAKHIDLDAHRDDGGRPILQALCLIVKGMVTGGINNPQQQIAGEQTAPSGDSQTMLFNPFLGSSFAYEWGWPEGFFGNLMWDPMISGFTVPFE